jgi:hypothetical protein
LAGLLTLLGRHGQRPLNAVLLGGGAAALCLVGLKGALHAWVPGVAAIVLGVLAALFGAAAEAWGTAAAVAAVLCAAGSLASRRLGIFWPAAAVLFAGLGLLSGMRSRERIPLVMPPVFCAIFIALGAAICWAPHWRGARLWQLNDVDWLLGLAGVLAVALLALSLEREYRRKQKLEAGSHQRDDRQLKKRIEAQKAAYQRAQAAQEKEKEEEKDPTVH